MGIEIFSQIPIVFRGALNIPPLSPPSVFLAFALSSLSDVINTKYTEKKGCSSTSTHKKLTERFYLLKRASLTSHKKGD